MQKDWTIYTLSDPRTQRVRYVGVTHQAVRRRYSGHLSRARRGDKTHRDNWIRSLLALGLNPLCAVIERGSGKSWKNAECQWIALYRGACDLTNLTDGGDGTLGYHHSPEMRAKLCGRPSSPATRAKLSVAGRGNKNSLGYHHSPEMRAKVSTANRGKVRTPAMREHYSLAKQINRKPVVCVETGDAFPCAAVAARVVEVSRSTLLRAIREKKWCLGQHFRFVDLGDYGKI